MSEKQNLTIDGLRELLYNYLDGIETMTEAWELNDLVEEYRKDVADHVFISAENGLDDDLEEFEEDEY